LSLKVAGEELIEEDVVGEDVSRRRGRRSPERNLIEESSPERRLLGRSSGKLGRIEGSWGEALMQGGGRHRRGHRGGLHAHAHAHAHAHVRERGRIEVGEIWRKKIEVGE
jgi:hypothetical protein